jgi:hypothetical protein
MFVKIGNLLPITNTARVILIGLGVVVAGGFIWDLFIVYSLREVRAGIAILAFSLGITVGLFVVVDFHRLTLENGATVLSCIFGITLAFYLLYKTPAPTSRNSQPRLQKQTPHSQRRPKG